MLSVAEAQKLILACAVGRRALLSSGDFWLPGAILADDVRSDFDSPPHDKTMVDGYAVVASDLRSGAAELLVLEEVTAGALPTQPVVAGAATRIMTGAPLPNGADAVVLIERSELLPASGAQPVRVRIVDALPRPGQNILRRGLSFRAGQTVLAAGREMTPAAIGVAAEVGCEQLRVFAPVTVAILATGNELVEPPARPAPGQICNSNGPMLSAAAGRAGAQNTNLGIARDEIEALAAKIAAGLQHDILVISGGVSAGVLDLVPRVLHDLGVEQVFHKVNLKPGKPLWFGVKSAGASMEDDTAQRSRPMPQEGTGQRSQPMPEGAAGKRSLPVPGMHNTLVFGLPGNPVSSLVCFELFVRPAIRRMLGHQDSGASKIITAELTAEFHQRGDRPTYFPSRLDPSTTPPRVTPVVWRGSADLYGFSQGNALAIFPAGDHHYPAGHMLEVIPL